MMENPSGDAKALRRRAAKYRIYRIAALNDIAKTRKTCN